MGVLGVERMLVHLVPEVERMLVRLVLEVV